MQTAGFTEAKGSPAPSLAPNTEEIPASLDPQRPLHLATCFLQIPFPGSTPGSSGHVHGSHDPQLRSDAKRLESTSLVHIHESPTPRFWWRRESQSSMEHICVFPQDSHVSQLTVNEEATIPAGDSAVKGTNGGHWGKAHGQGWPLLFLG